jgi:hypothetical protein
MPAAQRTAVTRRCEQGWHPEFCGDKRPPHPAARFRKEKTVGRRATADLWTTNRQDACLANQFTKKF